MSIRLTDQESQYISESMNFSNIFYGITWCLSSHKGQCHKDYEFAAICACRFRSHPPNTKLPRLNSVALWVRLHEGLSPTHPMNKPAAICAGVQAGKNPIPTQHKPCNLLCRSPTHPMQNLQTFSVGVHAGKSPTHLTQNFTLLCRSAGR